MSKMLRRRLCWRQRRGDDAKHDDNNCRQDLCVLTYTKKYALLCVYYNHNGDKLNKHEPKTLQNY